MKDAMLIVHLLGLIMGVGTGIGHLFLGMAASKMEEKEGSDFQRKTLALSSMARIGLVLSILSGGYLMTPYWSKLPESPILMAKMGFVLLLIALTGMMEMNAKKAKQPGGEASFKKLESLGKTSLLVGLVILILAVLFFH